MLDPFNGSGTSMIFAARSHVRAIGIDLNKEYCEHTVSELKRLGALMKHQYPKHSNWLDHEKRDYWQLMNQLNDLARKLQESILKGQ